MIAVAIIEDDSAFARHLQDLFAADPGFECVATCASVDEALTKIPSSAPDVILVDVFLGAEQFGYDLIPPLRARLPHAEFMMLTRTGDYDQIFTSIVAGANGYLLKTEPDERILQAVRAMQEHEAVMTNSIARKVMRVFRQMAGHQAPPSVSLTPKETDVLVLVERGKQFGEVADQLEISIRTVHTHIRNIYKKLQASNKHEALRKWRAMSLRAGGRTLGTFQGRPCFGVGLRVVSNQQPNQQP